MNTFEGEDTKEGNKDVTAVEEVGTTPHSWAKSEISDANVAFIDCSHVIQRDS